MPEITKNDSFLHYQGALWPAQTCLRDRFDSTSLQSISLTLVGLKNMLLLEQANSKRKNLFEEQGTNVYF